MQAMQQNQNGTSTNTDILINAAGSRIHIKVYALIATKFFIRILKIFTVGYIVSEKDNVGKLDINTWRNETRLFSLH